MIMYCFHNNDPIHFTIIQNLQMIDLKYAFRSMIDCSGFNRSDGSFSRIVWPLVFKVFNYLFRLWLKLIYISIRGLTDWKLWLKGHKYISNPQYDTSCQVFWSESKPLWGGGGGGGFPSQWYIFLSKSLAKGVFCFLRKPLNIGILGLHYRLFFFKIFPSQGNIWAKIP